MEFSRTKIWDFFFFQAEDGIRDADVTGVQTCALPIFQHADEPARFTHHMVFRTPVAEKYHGTTPWGKKFREIVDPLCEEPPAFVVVAPVTRSEERRVGKEGRDRAASGLEIRGTVRVRD